VIPNEDGRVLAAPGGEHLPGEYVVGWIKRGPSGVIGTNKKDAHETVDHLLEDLDAGVLPAPSQPAGDAIEELLSERKPDHVTYSGWEAIDAAERSAGEPHERPRVKLTRLHQLLDAAKAATRSG
jgi:ferredoxin--NADP+ reductase